MPEYSDKVFTKLVTPTFGVTLSHESRDMEVGHEGGLCERAASYRGS
jgi:hypothetical protein